MAIFLTKGVALCGVEYTAQLFFKIITNYTILPKERNMTQILLIGSSQTSDRIDEYYGEYADFFSRSIVESGKDISLRWTLFDDLLVQVGDGNFMIEDTRSGLDISQFDAILIRGKGFRRFFDLVRAVSSYSRLHNIPVINDYSSFRDSSKLAQAVQFYEVGLPVATTVYVNQALLANPSALPFEFPCVLKAVFGAHGEDNYLVHSMDEVKEIAAHSNLRFVMQRFVPNDNDFRILVAGERTIAISRKAVDGSHLNNTSQGGSAYLVPEDSLPDGMIADAIKITRHLDMTIAGVDALIDKHTGNYFFLEVNSQPQLMSGAFVHEKAKLIGGLFATIIVDRDKPSRS